MSMVALMLSVVLASRGLTRGDMRVTGSGLVLLLASLLVAVVGL